MLQVSATLWTMSGHTVDVLAARTDKIEWHAICRTCGNKSVGWSYDADEAQQIADAHAADSDEPTPQ